MKKEMLLAVLIGLIVGLILTYGFYRARNFGINQRNPELTETATTSNSPIPSSNSSLVIISPEDELVVAEKKITVAGTTSPNSQVVIFVNNEESLTTADSSGNFSTERTLQAGGNIITVHALNENGVATTLERTVVVADPETITTQTATPSGETR